MKPPAAISTYMRKLQRKSASKRWAGLTPEQRSEQMASVAKARWANTRLIRRVLHGEFAP